MVTKTFVVDDTGLPNDDDMTYIEDENAELLENIYNAETQIDSWHDNRCGSAPHNSTKVCSRYFCILYACFFSNVEPLNNSSLYEDLSH